MGGHHLLVGTVLTSTDGWAPHHWLDVPLFTSWVGITSWLGGHHLLVGRALPPIWMGLTSTDGWAPHQWLGGAHLDGWAGPTSMVRHAPSHQLSGHHPPVGWAPRPSWAGTTSHLGRHRLPVGQAPPPSWAGTTSMVGQALPRWLGGPYQLGISS